MRQIPAGNPLFLPVFGNILAHFERLFKLFQGRRNILLKFIHCADLHLGSPLQDIRPEEARETRQTELRGAFARLAGYAEAEGVTAVLLAGDVFDKARPGKKDKEFFYSVVKTHPNVDFLYLKGNHDSLASYAEELPNLKLFGSQWQYYTYGNLRIAGLELGDENCESCYRTYQSDPSRRNIVLLHGMLGDAAGPCEIDRRKLAGLGIDYVALGHVHGYREEKIDARCTAAYAGCLEGRGYDETGEKGFILLETGDGGLTHTFVPFADRRVFLLQTDVTGLDSLYDVLEKIRKESPARPADLMRVELCGTVPFAAKGLEQELETLLKDKYYSVSVKDKTRRHIDPGDYENDISLRGEFIRGLYADTEMDDALRQEVLALGLRVLNGEEAEE